MNTVKSSESELIELMRIIKKRFYIIFLVTIPVMALIFYYFNYMVKPVYSVKIGYIIGNTISSTDSYDIGLVTDYEKLLETYSALAKTSVVAENAAKNLSFNLSPDLIQNSIIPVPEPGTQFIYLGMTWRDPQQAKEILNAVSTAFIAEAKSIYPTCNIKVIENIKTPVPIVPDQKKYLILGFAGSIFVSILIIFGIDFFDNTIKTEEDIEEYLNVPVFSEIPKDKKKLQALSSKSMLNLNYGIVEAFRSLRTSIEFASVYKNVKSIIVTSSRPGEGKSTTAAMLALVMAGVGKRTILVDCDLRNPSLHKIFNVSNLQGLSNFLVGNLALGDTIHKSEIDNLYILTSGVKPPNPAEILSSLKMKNFIEALKNDFDYVILDTPPVGLVTDAQIMSQYTDGCIFVVASGEAIKTEVVKAKRLIENVNGRILGAALNKVKNSVSYSRYNYYYSSGAKKNKKKLSRMFNKKSNEIIKPEAAQAKNNESNVNSESGFIL